MIGHAQFNLRAFTETFHADRLPPRVAVGVFDGVVAGFDQRQVARGLLLFRAALSAKRRTAWAASRTSLRSHASASFNVAGLEKAERRDMPSGFDNFEEAVHARQLE